MLKKISVRQATRGMYIHKLEGSWMQHSFWRTEFLLDDDRTLGQLHDCGAAECWIDVDKGCDVVTASTPAAEAPVAPALTAAPEWKPVPMEQELQQAVLIRDRAGRAVRNMFREARMGGAIDPKSFVPLVNDIVNSVNRHGEALVSLSRLKRADEYTYMHSVAVCALMVSLGRQLGLDEEESRLAGMAGLMHDIGKAGTPLEILNKPGSLTDPEFEVMRQHPAHGEKLLRESGFVEEAVLDVVRHHHERISGKGYPDRLLPERISRLARMGAVCDVYDAITSDRPYKKGWDPAEALARMATWKGHFDEDILRAFIRSLGIYPTGSLVRLASGRLAVVVEQNRGKITAPRVKVFFSTTSGTQLKPQLLDLGQSGCVDKIVSREARHNWPFTHIEDIWRGETT